MTKFSMTKLIRRPTSGRQDFLYVPLILASLILFAQPATAQDEEVLDEIVTTGSLIKRETSSNIVVTLDAEDFIDRGATNAVEILDTITSIQAREVTSNTLNLFNPSFANFANLRSLGGQSTLTLLDGKRVVRDPFAGIAVNLNALPQAAISSVDVLPDGASSIYGSDAIAGVINFKMHDEYEGFGFNGMSTFPAEGDGGELNRASAIFGVGDLDADGYNFYVAASHRKRDDLRPGDRSYTEGPWGGNVGRIAEPGGDPTFGGRQEAFPGNVRQRNNPLASGQIATGTGASPYPDCPVMSDQLSARDLHAVGNGSCIYTLTGINWVIISEEEQETVSSQLSKRLGEDHTFSLQFFHSWSDITRERPWPRIQGRQIPITSPYYPGNGIVPAIAGQDLTSPVQVHGMSIVALERPEETVTDRTWRLMASVDGVIGAFDYEVWALQSEAEFEQAIVSYDNRWIDGIDRRDDDTAPWINPWADFAGQSPEAQAWITGNYMGKVKDRIADSQLKNVGFTLGRDIEQIDFGAGAAALAFAVEYTEEELFTGLSLERLAATNQTPEVRLGPDRNTLGDRDLYSATLEVLLPITEGLEVSASVRYDDYSDVGGTTNPKLLVNYDVTSNVNLHASFGTGFRAPTLVDLFRARSLVGTIPAASFIYDQELCTDGMTPNDPQDDPMNACDLRVNRISGGNLDLKPEESDTFSIGTMLNFETGLGDLAIGIDYWDYKIDNVINSGIPPEAIFGDWDQFASGFIFRCSTFTGEEIDGLNNCPDDPALRFNDYIGAVLQTNANIGILETSGVDVKFLWNLPTTDIGDWLFTYNATYVNDYDQEVYEGAGAESRVDRFVTRSFGPVLQYKHYATLRWSRNDWSAFLQHQYQNGYDDCGSVCGKPDRKVDSHGILNIGATYQINDAIQVSLRVENLAQNDPPFTNNTGAGSITTANTDVRYFDHIGRRVGLTLVGNWGGD